MTEAVDRTDVTTKWLRRIARIWSIIVIAFTLFMFVAHIIGPDEYSVDYHPIENLQPVLMVLSVLSLALAWRWEWLGGVLNISFFVANLLLYWGIHSRFFPLPGLATLSLAIVPGVLFLICWWRTRR